MTHALQSKAVSLDFTRGVTKRGRNLKQAWIQLLQATKNCSFMLESADSE